MDALRAALAGVQLADAPIVLAKVPGSATLYTKDLDGSSAAATLAKVSNYHVLNAMFKRYKGDAKEVSDDAIDCERDARTRLELIIRVALYFLGLSRENATTDARDAPRARF